MTCTTIQSLINEYDILVVECPNFIEYCSSKISHLVTKCPEERAHLSMIIIGVRPKDWELITLLYIKYLLMGLVLFWFAGH